MLTLIGSRAMNLRLPEWEHRATTDIDLVGPLDETQRWFKERFGKPDRSYPIAGGKKWLMTQGKTICETEITWPGSSAHQLQMATARDAETKCLKDGTFLPTLDFLYGLKLTHRYLKNSPHFLKTMRDVQAMRRSGAKIPEHHKEFLTQREKDTYAYKHPSLNQTKKDFFNGDGVNYVYDHDDIHRIVALPDQPAYKLFAKDGSEVASDKGKFAFLPRSEQLRAVREESCVLAIERSLVPHPGALTPEQAFRTALMKVCTSITSGWFREFAWENYDSVVATYEDTYATRFFAAVDRGEVKLHAAV